MFVYKSIEMVSCPKWFSLVMFEYEQDLNDLKLQLILQVDTTTLQCQAHAISE